MRRTVRSLLALPVAALGVGLVVLVGVALAKATTLDVAKNATVTNTKGLTTHESIAVTSKGLAVYTLSGDSKSHPECTAGNHCFMFWPPAVVSSAKHLSKASGIKGKLGVWRRDGFDQLTLNGHPLYLFSGDGTKRDSASGEGIVSFGGTWHVVALSAPSGSSSSPPSTSTTSPGTPNPNPNPPPVTTPYSPPTTTPTTPTTTTPTNPTPPYYP